MQPHTPPNGDRSPKPSRAAYEKLRSARRSSEDNIEVSIPRVALWKCFISALVLATVSVVCCVVAIVLARFDVSWVDVVPLPGSGSSSNQVDGTLGATVARFNCSKDYVTWQLDWSMRKQRWCCAHTGRACPPANRHDCQATAAQVEAWSEDKRRYCCKHENYGCPSSYDCVDRRGSQFLWDSVKRKWCCKHKNYGCPLATLSNTSSSHHTAPSHEPSNSSNSSSNSSNRSNSSSIVNRVSSPKYVGSDVGTATGSAHLMLHSRKDANSSNSSRTGAAVSSGTSSSSRAHHVSARRLRAAEVVQDFFHQHTQELGEPAVSPKQLSSHSLRGLPVDNSVQMQ